MSVLNLQNSKDFLNNKLFFDNSIGITRFDKQKYLWIEKLTRQQIGFFWVPEEIDLTKDERDFKHLSDVEQHIFSSNIKRQIMLDSIQSRSPSLAFLPRCSLPELENWITLWSFNESIHSRSYTHIIRNIYTDPSIIFDNLLNIKEIVDCSNDITKYYDDIINFDCIFNKYDSADYLPMIKETLWLALMAVNILEGIRFYASFACSWAFGEVKKMEGNASIIRLISRDENCVSEDTEILTDKGWKFFKDLDRTEKVAQFTNDRKIEFVSPEKYIEKEFSGDMISFKNSKHDILVTPNHRMIYIENDVIKEKSAFDFNPSCSKSYFVAAEKKTGTSNNLTNLERFKITYQADGYFDKRINGNICGTNTLRFYFKKKRKIERFNILLESLDFDYTKSYIEEKDGYIFYVRVPIEYEFSVDKGFSWVDLNSVTSNWCKEFIEELSHWDGHLPNDNMSRIYYSSIREDCVDIVQSIAILAGYRCMKSIETDDRKETYNDVYRINILTESNTANCGDKRNVKTLVPYNGMVYCVSVPSGMIVTRRNGKVVVIGNCHLAFTQQLLKTLPKDDEDFISIKEKTTDKCIEMFMSCVEQEKEWAKYLFKDGSIIGLNEKLLCDYIEWIADKRMKAIGLKSPYKGGYNPLPWTQRWISSGEVQAAPQEKSIDSYVIGGIKQDVSNTTFGNFKL